jgi:limonene-1,2-epoxide hydrolase
MTEQTSESTNTANATNANTVETFLYALQAQDFATMDALLADDVVYQNVGLPTIHGRSRVVKMMRGMEGKMGFEVKFHRNVAEGSTVLNERTDAMTFGPLRLQFWVCGVFEVENGQITLWRDYFDFLDMLKATVRGVLGIAVPALRKSM